MTPAVESAVKEYIRRRDYCDRHREQQPGFGILLYGQAKYGLAAALGMESISLEQADLIADTYLAEIDPPNRRPARAVAR